MRVNNLNILTDNKRIGDYNSKKINFGRGINPARVMDPDVIIRNYKNNKFGLKSEIIQYFKGTNNILSHWRKYFGIPGKISFTEFSPEGIKTTSVTNHSMDFGYASFESEKKVLK